MKDKNFTWINIIFIILSVFWMGTIFYFSNKTADESNNTSDAVETAIGKATVVDFEEKSDEDLVDFLDRYRVMARKTAHVLEFALLLILFFMAMPFSISIKIRYIVAVLWTILYAISDEIHQSFIPGRTGLISDVFIDTGGALIGILVIFAFRIISVRSRRENMR